MRKMGVLFLALTMILLVGCAFCHGTDSPGGS